MKEQMKNRLFRITDYFDNNILFQSVRQGMVMMIPILVSSAVALVIALAREEKLLHDIEAYMFDEAAHTISEIEKEIHTEFKISVNITNESLLWEDLEFCIADKVRKYHIAPARLWLEITEQDALISSREVLDKMRRIKEQGHKFLIDDFGMGHTSLLYLQTNCFSVVKLDGSLTKDV